MSKDRETEGHTWVKKLCKNQPGRHRESKEVGKKEGKKP